MNSLICSQKTEKTLAESPKGLAENPKGLAESPEGLAPHFGLVDLLLVMQLECGDRRFLPDSDDIYCISTNIVIA